MKGFLSLWITLKISYPAIGILYLVQPETESRADSTPWGSIAAGNIKSFKKCPGRLHPWSERQKLSAVRLGKRIATTCTGLQWYARRVPDIARTAARMKGGGETPASTAGCCSCCCPYRGSSVKYGRFEPEAQPCQVFRHGCPSFKNAGADEAPKNSCYTFMLFLFDLRVKEESHKNRKNGGILYDRHPNEKRDQL